MESGQQLKKTRPKIENISPKYLFIIVPSSSPSLGCVGTKMPMFLTMKFLRKELMNVKRLNI
jgi:hypothetical protein